MLKVNTISTVNGIASISVGSIDTRATNQVCSRNSRHANGGRNIRTNVSSDIAKKPPTRAPACRPDTSPSAVPPRRGRQRAGAPRRPQLQIVMISRRHGRNAIEATSTVTAPPRGIMRPSSESQGPRPCLAGPDMDLLCGARSERRMPELPLTVSRQALAAEPL